MSQFKDIAIEGTVYFWFAANLTTGAAGDGATPLFDVRLAGAAADAAPVLSGTPTLLTHANYTDGLHEIAVAATSGNGFAAGNEYAVFCTLTISSVNPAGFVGSFKLVASGDTLHSAAARIMDITDASRIKADLDTIKAQAVTCGAGVTVGVYVGGTGAAALEATAQEILTDTGTTLDGKLNTIDDFLDTEVAAILADTNELQTDWVNGGRLDLLIDAVKTKTDALPASPAAAGDIPSASAIADQVWDEALAGHLGAGSTGEALNAAGAAGDPWTTQLPGAYGAGSAGKIIGDNVNAPIATVDTVVDAIKAKTDNLPADPADQSAVEAAITAATSPLATAAALTVVDDFLDTEIAAIKAKTDNLPTDPADQSAVEAAITAATSPLATAAALAVVDDFLDTEIAAIKAKTDNLPASPAAVGSAMTLADGAITAAVLATGAIDADALAADAVDEILDEVVEGTVTVRQALRLFLSVLAGKSTGGGTVTLAFRDNADTKARVTATVDENGNRTAVALDPT